MINVITTNHLNETLLAQLMDVLLKIDKFVHEVNSPNEKYTVPNNPNFGYIYEKVVTMDHHLFMYVPENRRTLSIKIDRYKNYTVVTTSKERGKNVNEELPKEQIAEINVFLESIEKQFNLEQWTKINAVQPPNLPVGALGGRRHNSHHNNFRSIAVNEESVEEKSLPATPIPD